MGCKKVARGGALASVAKDFSAMGTVNAMNEKNGEGDFFAGSMKQGREGANKTMAEDEVWGAKTDAEKVSFMSKVKENQKVAAFGSVEAEHARIMKEHGVAGAIANAVTGGKEKGISNQVHFDNMRTTFGDDLETGKKLEGMDKPMTFADSVDAADQGKINSSLMGVAGAGGKNKYIDLQGKNAFMKSADDAGSILGTGGPMSGKWNQKHSQSFQDNLIKDLEDNEAGMGEFKDASGKALTGGDLMRAEAANRERKFALAKSLVDGKGQSVSFSAGTDGHVGQMSLDGVQKISSGTERSTGAEVASMIEGHNLANKDKVSLDANGHIQGSQEAKKSFGKFLQTKQYTEAQIKGILGEAGAGINSFVPEEYEDVAKTGLLTAVGSVAAYNLGGKQLISAVRGKPDPISKTKDDSNSNTNNNTSDKTNPESHIQSFNEKLEDYNKNIKNSEAELVENRAEYKKLSQNKDLAKTDASKANIQKQMDGLDTKAGELHDSIETSKKGMTDLADTVSGGKRTKSSVSGFMDEAVETYEHAKGGILKRAGNTVLTMAGFAGLGAMLSPSDAEASGFPAKAVIPKAQQIPETSFLEGASNMFADAEMFGGLGTLGASAMSKFSSIAASVAKVGSRAMPGVGIAFGAADTAYRASEGDNLGDKKIF